MNRAELLKQLKAEFNLVCFEDLAEVSASPYYVYKLFHSLHKTSYKPNERLVFYSGETPNHDLVNHLYRAAELIDISEFFIVIYDSIVDARPLQNNFTIPNTICPLPWMHLEVDIQGKIKPCCFSSSDLHTNSKPLSLIDAFKSTELENIRQGLLQGQRLKQCTQCWQLEDRGIDSQRQRLLQSLSRDFLSNYIHNPQIKSLDIKPSNACNFKCRICNPVSSSLHAAEQARANNIIAKQSSSHVDILFNQELPQIVEQLENVDFYGGEPFFIKQVIKFVDECTRNQHAQHLRLHFNTNGSVYPKQIEHCWQHYKHVNIQFSIDDIGERFELQRGGSWEQVHANIKRFLDLDLPNMTFGIMPAISIMNVLYLDDLFEWADSLNLPIFIQIVDKPPEYYLENLTPMAKQHLLDKYKNSCHSEIQKIYHMIDNIKLNPNGAELFKNKINYFDQLRNQSFQTSHYEIAKLMGMC